MITRVSEENRHSLQAQLVPKCCSMRNFDRNQPAAGSSSISEKYQGAENALSAVRLLQSRDQQNLTCVPNCKKQQSLFLNQLQYSVTMSLKGTESLFHISQEENIDNVSVKICVFPQLLGGC